MDGWQLAVIRKQETVSSNQLAVISKQLSMTNYQLSTLIYPLSTLSTKLRPPADLPFLREVPAICGGWVLNKTFLVYTL